MDVSKGGVEFQQIRDNLSDVKRYVFLLSCSHSLNEVLSEPHSTTVYPATVVETGFSLKPSGKWKSIYRVRVVLGHVSRLRKDELDAF